MIIIIAAAGKNNELGKNNGLLWHLPDDFKRFKALTSGHCIIMGRKTFESFSKPLPNRTHIIITRQKDYKAPIGCIVVSNLKNAINSCPKDQDIYIIGGGEIYKQALPYTDKIELTRVNDTFKADTFFPDIKKENWKLVSEVFHDKDEKHKYSFTYQTFESTSQKNL